MSDPFYNTPEWRMVRGIILLHNPVCQVPGCGGKSKHVDHKVARSKGGAALAPSNLMALCHSCHSRKTASQDRGFGNKAKVAYELRAVGCDVNGQPLDPKHHWSNGG